MDEVSMLINNLYRCHRKLILYIAIYNFASSWPYIFFLHSFSHPHFSSSNGEPTHRFGSLSATRLIWPIRPVRWQVRPWNPHVRPHWTRGRIRLRRFRRTFSGSLLSFLLSLQLPSPTSIFSEPAKWYPRKDKVSVFRRRSSRKFCGTTWVARAPSTSRKGSRATTRVTGKDLRCIWRGRTWTTPARTRSIMRLLRLCWRRGWGRKGSLPKLVQGSMGWLLLLCVRGLSWSVWYIWGRGIWRDRLLMCSECGFLVLRCVR